MGIMLMDSVPPATMISAPPTMMRSAPRAMACNPEEQKRLMVMAEHSTGSPARSDAMRATFMPCSASGVAHPMITSSIWPLSTCGTRSSAPLMTVAAMSSGRVARNVPLPDLPTAVRTELTMTTSFMRVLLAAGYWSASTWYLVLGTWYLVLGTWYLVLGTRPAFAALVFRSPD